MNEKRGRRPEVMVRAEKREGKDQSPGRKRNKASFFL